jgi:hypothetical protein
MAITVLCPHCRRAAAVDPLVARKCPHCGEAYPEELLAALNEGARPPRPFLLSVWMWVGSVLGVLMLISAAFAGTPGSEAQLHTLESAGIELPDYPPIVWILLPLAKGALLTWSAWTLRAERAGARMAMMWAVFVFTVPEAVLLAPGLARSDVGRTLFLVLALLSMCCLWMAYGYLYVRKNVVAYFEALADAERREV